MNETNTLLDVSFKIKSSTFYRNCMSSFIMNTLLITTLFALSYASYNFLDSGFNPPRKSVTSYKRWQRKTAKSGCRRAKCPNNDEYCVKPKCYPHAEIDKALHDRQDKVHPHKTRSSGNCSTVHFSECHVFFFWIVISHKH